MKIGSYSFKFKAVISRFSIHFLIGLTTLLAGCSGQSQKSQYLLAERLWSDHNLVAAVAAFEKAAARDPKSKMGLQALYRAADTQLLYLNQPADAILKLKAYSELTPDHQASWEALLEIGDIYYSKLDSPDSAIQHYLKLIALRPEAPEMPEMLYRIARSKFLISRFNEAIEGYKSLALRFPQTEQGERAEYEVGMSYFTKAEHGSDNYDFAISAFKKFLTNHPKSKWVVDAKFGIASSLAEQDHLEEAESLYSEILNQYPSPNVIRIKLLRIKERKSQKRR